MIKRVGGGEKGEERMKRGTGGPTTMSKKRESGAVQRAEAGTQTDDATDATDATGATDATRGGVGYCTSAEEKASLSSSWRARVRAAVAGLVALVEEGDATVAGDVNVAADATVAPACVPTPPKGQGAACKSDEAAKARLRRDSAGVGVPWVGERRGGRGG